MYHNLLHVIVLTDIVVYDRLLNCKAGRSLEVGSAATRLMNFNEVINTNSHQPHFW